ncbi:MAG: TonB-dependent receptor domain-containing protein, partial [Pyrinomonadaceae bacterium]
MAPLTQSGLVFTPPATGVADPNGVVRFGQAANTLGNIDFVLAPGGSLQRNFARQGFGLFSNQDRNRYEASARLQNIYKGHTFKYGFEWYRNIYNINTLSTGPSQTFGKPIGLTLTGGDGNNQHNCFRVTNNFYVCTTRGTQVVCPVGSSTRSQFPVFAAQQLIAAGRLPGFTSAVGGAITQAEFFNNPLLIRSSTRVRDFELVANTYTNVESAYIQDDYKISPTVTVNLGLRWDFQQAYGNNSVTYLKLNNFLANTQPRVGVVWDFTGKGKGKLFANYGRFIETPIPLDVNVRAGSNDTQTDKNINVDRANAVAGSILVPGLRNNWATGAVNLGAEATPLDPGLRPQSMEEFTGGFEYEIAPNFVFGTRGVYRNYVNVIEDGSFDDGDTYFLFNPGRRGTGETTEDLACSNPDIGCFGRARRYYRAIEFSATKRFTNNYQFIASYVYSSLIGNYEGLFRNDNGQSDPNITSLFDLVSLLANTYGRLPNDRPHQFKFNGSYQTPWKLMISGNFYAQSGVPFNQL